MKNDARLDNVKTALKDNAISLGVAEQRKATYKHWEWDIPPTRHCEELHTHFSAYIDKELPAWKRLLVRQHLKRCPNCAFHVRRLEQMDKFLRAEESLPSSDDFVASVMTRASKMYQHQREHRSPLFAIGKRLARCVETSLGWARQNIPAHSPPGLAGTFALCFTIFTMVGVTLYAPPGDRFAGTTRAELDTAEKLISFEVIRDEQPKRSLKMPQFR